MLFRALLAALGGMPLEEVAERLGTGRQRALQAPEQRPQTVNRRMVVEMLSPQEVF